MKNFEIIEKICGGSGEYGIGDIVRCKDCRFYGGEDAIILFGKTQCSYNCLFGVTEDFFCRDGEKPVPLD